MHVPKRWVLQTKVIICGRLEHEVVMDDYSVIKSITRIMVSILGWNFFPKQSPFVTKMRFLIDRRVNISISLGNYLEEVWCDVVHLDARQMWLEIYDSKVMNFSIITTQTRAWSWQASQVHRRSEVTSLALSTKIQYNIATKLLYKMRWKNMIHEIIICKFPPFSPHARH